MSRPYYRSPASFQFGPPLTPGVRALMIACAITFVVQVIDQIAGGPSLTRKFGLTPAMVTGNYYAWQVVTYIFLHGGFFHILFNMFSLWMFGSELESHWRKREFMKFFFICGIGAAIATILVSPQSGVTTIGASGSIYGILLAYGLLFPHRIIYIYGLIPIPAKYFVWIIGAITFLSSISASGSPVAHLAHLGGMVFGLLYLKGPNIFSDARSRFERWQRYRLRRKFDVYYNQRHSDQDHRRNWRN